MTIIICVDDNWGIMFNHRRQSQDKIVREHILKEIKGNTLRMNSYSAKMFGKHPQICVDEDFMDMAAPDDYCFVEDCSVSPYKQQISQVIVYKWNRNYPADQYFDMSLTDNGWRLISSEDFVGNSHEKITKERYIK